MITKSFSIYDNKALVYSPPFFAPTVGLAIRSFTDLVNDSQTTINRHPNDFFLCQLGDFDDSKGVFTCLPKPVNLGLAVEFLRPSVKEVNPVLPLKEAK